jgi:hypothetical protein
VQTFPHKKWNPFVQLDLHDGIFLQPPPVIPIAGKAMHIGAGVLAMPWIYLGSPKINDNKVLGDGMELVSRGHEPKYLIVPHLNLFPFTPAQINLMIPLLILGSSSKCVFAVGSVVGKDGPIAVSIFSYVGINQACASPCNMPTSLVVNWGTVILGFTWGDLLAAVLIIAADSLISYIQGKIFDKLFDKFLPKGLFKSQTMAMLRRFNISRVFRGPGGRFASLSESLVGGAAKGVFGLVYGQLLGGSAGQAAGIPNFDPFSRTGDAATAGAEQVGAWVDGRSETFPP